MVKSRAGAQIYFNDLNNLYQRFTIDHANAIMHECDKKSLLSLNYSKNYYYKYFLEDLAYQYSDIFIQEAKSRVEGLASELLVEISRDHHGQLFECKYTGGSHFETNNQKWSSDSPRNNALIRDAIKQLIENELIQQSPDDSHIWLLTKRGYEEADKLSPHNTVNQNKVKLLSSEASSILQALAIDDDGLLFKTDDMGSVYEYYTVGEYSYKAENALDESKYIDAVKELLNDGFIAYYNNQTDIWKITTKGYQEAKRLNASK